MCTTKLENTHDTFKVVLQWKQVPAVTVNITSRTNIID